MGNDQSHLTGIEIEEKSIEVSDFWTHHSSTVTSSENTTSLSVLIGEIFVEGPLWTSQTPLEKFSKNLKIFRHPYIVRYISSWSKGSKFFLAVEEVTPLSHVLSFQNSLQVCIGLHSILKALCFLHDKAQVSHNNVCLASIYVTKDGSWKLGGMEYLSKFTELTIDYLKKSKSHRYSKGIDANEEKNFARTTRRDFVDIYAYSVLVNEILKLKTDLDISTLSNFREVCTSQLQNLVVDARPPLNTLLKHEFFNHDFIIIHSFLTELPLKSDEEKSSFFQTLSGKLRNFNETTVANQLGSLLLSRMVLLNKTAQEQLLPQVLCPKSNDDKLFSEETFKEYLTPKLLEIFSVRDAQIRLLLLRHFENFVQCFTSDELQSCILPELLLGIKDTNDSLVAMTLRTLADLVPILGATTVIGGKRGKLFNDGRPTSKRSRKVFKRPENQVVIDLPERPRPDGEEVETSTEEAEQSVEEDLDTWENWGLENPPPEINSPNSSESLISVLETEPPVVKKSLPDISELDIKHQSVGEEEDIDFFQDMEPVIETSSKYIVENVNSKLSLNPNENADEEGWGEEEWE